MEEKREGQTGTYYTQQRVHKEETEMRKSANLGGQFEDYSI